MPFRGPVYGPIVDQDYGPDGSMTDEELQSILGPPSESPAYDAGSDFNPTSTDLLLERFAGGLGGIQLPQPQGLGQGFISGLFGGLGARGQRVATAREKFEQRQQARQLRLDEERRKATEKYNERRAELRGALAKEKRSETQRQAEYERDNPLVDENLVQQVPGLRSALGQRVPQATIDRLRFREPKEKPQEPIVPIQQADGSVVYVTRSQALGKSPPKPAARPRPSTGQERQTLAFYNRAKDALANIQTQDPSGTSLEQRIATQPILQQARGQRAPNYLQTADQQVYRQAQRAFTETRLRKESGAAISPKEYENDARIYFIQPGDSPRVIENKRKGRAAVLEGLRFGSGRAYDEFYGGADGSQGGGPEPTEADLEYVRSLGLE